MHPVISSASAVQVAKYDRATFRFPFLWFRVLQDVSHLPGINFSVLGDHTWNIGAVEAALHFMSGVQEEMFFVLFTLAHWLPLL